MVIEISPILPTEFTRINVGSTERILFSRVCVWYVSSMILGQFRGGVIVTEQGYDEKRCRLADSCLTKMVSCAAIFKAIYSA